MRQRSKSSSLLLLGGVVALFGTLPPTQVLDSMQQRARTGRVAQLDDLLPVPFPDLRELEESVAEQLSEMQELLLSRLAETEARWEELSEIYGELGRLYHAYSLTESAETCYLNASHLSAQDFRWAYYLAHLYQSVGRLEESNRYYQRALTLDPKSVPALVHLSEVHLAQNRLEDAESLLLQALELDPSSAAASAAWGQIALSRRQFQEAVDHLESALEQVPEANRLHYPLALAYRGLGDLEKARQHLAQRGMVGVRPRDPLIEELTELIRGESVHLVRGRMAFRAGRFADAAQEFRKAVAARPESARARINLGSALASLGDEDEAIDQYLRALNLAPENGTAHFNLGYLLARKGAYAKAVKHLEAAVEINPLDTAAHLELADALSRSGRLDDALRHYTRAVELEPLDERSRLREAEILVQQGRYMEARELLEDAHALMPDSGVVAHALARLLAACPELSLRDGSRALDLALRVFEARSSVHHAETVALALAEVGRCDEAAHWQRSAIAGAQASSEVERAEELQATLSHYEKGEPCRYPAVPSWKR